MYETIYQKIDKSITLNDLLELAKVVTEESPLKGNQGELEANNQNYKPNKKVIENLTSRKSNSENSLPNQEIRSPPKNSLNKSAKKKSNHFSNNVINKMKKRKQSQLSFEQINDDSNYFIRYMISLVNNAVGLKRANPPFDSHTDLLKKYLMNILHVKNFDENDEIVTHVLKFIVIDANISNNVGDNFDPYFKVYLPGKKLSNKHAYQSKHLDDERKPVWNECFHVPITKKEIADEKSIKLELWDHDPTTLSAALKDFKKVKSFGGIIRSTKDFLEVFFSSLLPCIQIDDRAGFCLINLDEVPSTGIKMTKKILDNSSKIEIGTIRMHLDWGSVKINNKRDKLISILMHMKLYSHCLNLHLEQERNDTIKELKIEKINYMLLFYRTELTLINQSRLNGCLTDYEDGMIRRAIIIRTILRLSGDAKNIRLLLSSMLVNEDLSPPESLIWIHPDYLKVLIEFEKINLNLLVEFYTTRFDAFKCLCFSKEFDCETLDVLQFLRTMVKYDQCYPDAKFDVKINLELKNYIINNLINAMLTNPKDWTKLANKLDFLDENLEKYWQRNIRTILDAQGVESIRAEYERIVYGAVKLKIEEWSKKKKFDPKSLEDNQLITWYFFCKKFEFIMFDDDRLINRGSQLGSEIKKKLSLRLNSHNSQLDILKSTRPDQLTSANLHKTTSDLVHESDQRSIEDSIERQHVGELEINDLTFCYLVNSRSISENLKKIFPSHLLNSWINNRVSYCMALSEVIVEEEINRLVHTINRLNVKDFKSNYSTVEKYFYETLTETLYFFSSLQYWDEQLFERTINKLCDCLCTFAKHYSRIAIDALKSNNTRHMNILVAISINELFRLNDKLLNRLLIQILTDLPADEVWKCIDKHEKLIRKRNEVTNKQNRMKGDKVNRLTDNVIKRSNEELINSLDSSNSKLIVKVCLRIRYTFKQIHKLINELEQSLGRQMIEEFEKNLHIILNSKRHNLVLRVVEQFELSLQNAFYFLVNRQAKVDLAIYIKHNLNINLRNVFMQLIEQYLAQIDDGETIHHLTKIEIIKLITISIRLKEHFKQLSDSFDYRTKKLTTPLLTGFYVDDSDFRDLVDGLFEETS